MGGTWHCGPFCNVFKSFTCMASPAILPGSLWAINIDGWYLALAETRGQCLSMASGMAIAVERLKRQRNVSIVSQRIMWAITPPDQEAGLACYMSWKSVYIWPYNYQHALTLRSPTDGEDSFWIGKGYRLSTNNTREAAYAFFLYWHLVSPLGSFLSCVSASTRTKCQQYRDQSLFKRDRQYGWIWRDKSTTNQQDACKRAISRRWSSEYQTGVHVQKDSEANEPRHIGCFHRVIWCPSARHTSLAHEQVNEVVAVGARSVQIGLFGLWTGFFLPIQITSWCLTQHCHHCNTWAIRDWTQGSWQNEGFQNRKSPW